MKDDLKIFLIGVFFIGLFVFGIWWQIYAYHDCKDVGHSTLYCVLRLGR